MKTTKCIECGVKVEYSTNKPKRCPSCRTKHSSKFKHTPKKPQRSKKEQTMQKILNDLLPKATYIDNGYYSWLESPKKAPLQLDRYYPDLKIAFEFNGRQHYEYNPYMHKDKAAFEYLKACDLKKKKDCKENNVTLITIKYNKPLSKEYIIKRLKQADVWDDILEETEVNE